MEMTKTWIAHTDLITLTLMSRARARKGADVGVVTPTRTDNHRHRRLFPARAREERVEKWVDAGERRRGIKRAL